VSNMIKQSRLEGWRRPAELARELRVSESHVYQLAKRGALETSRDLSGRLMVRKRRRRSLSTGLRAPGPRAPQQLQLWGA